jgi:hypothetical protein
MRDMPSTDRDAPMRAKLRSDSEAPRLAKPPTLMEEPMRVKLRIESDDPT